MKVKPGTRVAIRSKLSGGFERGLKIIRVFNGVYYVSQWGSGVYTIAVEYFYPDTCPLMGLFMDAL